MNDKNRNNKFFNKLKDRTLINKENQRYIYTSASQAEGREFESRFPL
jgi:hypothetical protein